MWPTKPVVTAAECAGRGGGRRYLGAGLALAVAAAVLSGCGSSQSTSSPTSATPGTITVFAAASLRQTFTELGKKFEAAHPGSKVQFSFAGSSDLAAQIKQGATADVFASADVPNMQKVLDAGQATEAPVTFAKNTLTIVTAPGNPKNVTRLGDLAKPDLTVVLCAPQVPCGSAAKRVEATAGVDIKPVSEESSVTDVLAKVTSGQADAGLVYVTDAKVAGSKVTAVAFPESSHAVNIYPIVVVAGTKKSDLAHQFESLVTGPDGRAVLSSAGFDLP